MKKSLALAGASAVAVGMLAGVAPATTASAAVASNCTAPKWDVHPDLISTGTFSWGDGTALRTAGYNDCTIVGRSYRGQGIDVHCSRVNSNGVNWVYARNTTTGKAGWASYSAVYTTGSVLPPRCG
ncbi:hypothetical protein [Aeromicrobium sp.]|jgi:hypothetical protein|uniref:hypothetical protein n=1 Tax=Aeromicrobium sp. TaxID=1871063 RepID=UPI004034790C